MSIPLEDHRIIVEKARREAYHSGYKQGRFDEFIEAQYGRADYDIVPVIRCKNCKRWETDDGMFKDIDERQWHHCPHIGIDTEEYFFCSEAERKDEYVTLHHEDIHFIDEESEKAFYDALAERKEECGHQ